MENAINYISFNKEIIALFLGLIIISNLIITLFYNAFKLKWPDLYFSVSDAAAFFISISFKRYLFFRFIPVFIILTILTGIFMKNQSISLAIYAGIISMIVHATLTNGKAIYDLVNNSKKIKIYFNISFQVVIHITTYVFLIFLGVFSGFLSKNPFIITITPTTQGLTDNIWSALLTVILIEYLRFAYKEKSIDLEEVLKRSMGNIDPEIFSEIMKISEKFKINPTLLKAICVVENIQRPKWLRRIESIKAFLRLTGTYGIMQVRTNNPISDSESVKIAGKQFFSNTQDIKDYETIVRVIKTYNNSIQYVDLVMRAINYIDPTQTLYPSGLG